MRFFFLSKLIGGRFSSLFLVTITLRIIKQCSSRWSNSISPLLLILLHRGKSHLCWSGYRSSKCSLVVIQITTQQLILIGIIQRKLEFFGDRQYVLGHVVHLSYANGDLHLSSTRCCRAPVSAAFYCSETFNCRSLIGYRSYGLVNRSKRTTRVR